MKKPRLVGFILTIAAGIAAGIVYGWVINPGEVVNASLDSLRKDYKADYVLMVAEIYASDGNTADAVKTLKSLNPSNPLAAVQEGLLTAQQMGYSITELRFMADLEKALTNSSAQEVSP